MKYNDGLFSSSKILNDLAVNALSGALKSRAWFISFTFCITSKSRGLPLIPYFFKAGVTAKQIVFSLRALSATTKFVTIGSSPKSTHSTEA